MMTFSEIRELPEMVKLLKLIFAALLLWALVFTLIILASDIDSQARSEADTADRVINAALLYKSHPATLSQKAPNSGGDDPYTVVSEVVATLKLEDKIVQLSTQSSGIILQIERLYGEEMAQLVTLFETQGLLVKTAEIKAVSIQKDRLLSAVFSLEGAK